MRRQSGFTLVEILVALAILATVMGALIQSAGTTASNAGRLRDRTVAQWVASNQLAQLQLSGVFAPVGSKTGSEEMLGSKWFWKSVVQKVEDEDLRRVDLEVRRQEDSKNPIISVAGFISDPKLNSRQSQPDQ